MIVQISSGQGPAECELAVVKLYNALKKEFKDIEILSKHRSKTNGCCTSITFFTSQDMSSLEGSIQWVCQSPFRPHHKRKNWFIGISIIPKAEDIKIDGEIKFEKFHCGGKGGQNVNKVETGVRLIHIPTGMTVTATEERSQYLNKKCALNKLNAKLNQLNIEEKCRQKNNAWMEHNKIIRGNPVRVYKGMIFKPVEGKGVKKDCRDKMPSTINIPQLVICETMKKSL